MTGCRCNDYTILKLILFLKWIFIVGWTKYYLKKKGTKHTNDVRHPHHEHSMALAGQPYGDAMEAMAPASGWSCSNKYKVIKIKL